MKYALKPKDWIAPVIGGLVGWFLSASPVLGVVIFVGLLMHPFAKVYVPYAQNNPKHLWFKRKIYGWGWTPVTWQGWLATVLYVALLVAFALTIDDNSPTREVMFTFVLPAVLLTVAFIRLAYAKGEKPKWQWGDND